MDISRRNFNIGLFSAIPAAMMVRPKVAAAKKESFVGAVSPEDIISHPHTAPVIDIDTNRGVSAYLHTTWGYYDYMRDTKNIPNWTLGGESIVPNRLINGMVYSLSYPPMPGILFLKGIAEIAMDGGILSGEQRKIIVRCPQLKEAFHRWGSALVPCDGE